MAKAFKWLYFAFFRWIYWTTWGENPGIERSGMNGADRSTIVSKNITWPQGLTIDHYSRRLYWVDAKQHTISSAKLDGSDQQVVIYSHISLPHPYGVTLFEDYVFWTDIVTDSVFKTRKFGNRTIEELARGLKRPMAIQVMHESRQPYCKLNILFSFSLQFFNQINNSQKVLSVYKLMLNLDTHCIIV